MSIALPRLLAVALHYKGIFNLADFSRILSEKTAVPAGWAMKGLLRGSLDP